jgi:WD40 repeat protein
MRGSRKWLAVCALLTSASVIAGMCGAVGLAQSVPLPVRTLGLSEISAAAFSPDLHYAAFTQARVIYLVETERWTVVYTLEGHADTVTAVTFSPDGLRLGSGALDKTVRVWDVSTGREVRRLQGHKPPVRCVAFSSNGEVLASGAEDSTIKLWDVSTEREICTLEGHAGSVVSVAFSPDDSLLASGSSDTTVKMWDLSAGRELRTLHGHTSSVPSVAFSPDGSLLVSAGWADRTARVWDVATGWEIRTLGGHAGAVASVAFSADGEMIASGVWESDSYRGYVGEAVVVWSALDGTALARLEASHFSRVRSVAFGQDGMTLAWAEASANVGMWDTASSHVLYWSQLRIGHADPVWAVAFSPDGTLLASGPGNMQKTQDPSLILWDIATGREIRRLEGSSCSTLALAFSPNGRLLASGSWTDTRARVWDVETGEKLLDLPHKYAVEAIAFSRDGALLATGTGGGYPLAGEVKLWDVATGAEIRVLQGHTKAVNSLAFSPDGRLLASASDDENVRLWMVGTGWVRTLVGHSEPVRAVAFTPDGTRLISADVRELIVWSTETGEQVTRLSLSMPRYHDSNYPSLSFSSDVRFLVVSTKSGLVGIFDVGTGSCLASLYGHNGSPVFAAALSLSGSLLASGADDMTVKLWDVSTVTGPVSAGEDCGGDLSCLVHLQQDGSGLCRVAETALIRATPRNLFGLR